MKLVSLETRTLNKLRKTIREATKRATPRSDVTPIGKDMQQRIISVIQDAHQQAMDLAIEETEDQSDEDVYDVSLDDSEDRAIAVAASILAVWMMAIVTGLTNIPAKLDYKLRVIAASEVWQAYNEAALQSYDSIESEMLKRWDATLDRKTCPACRAHDGETVALNKEFNNGDEPGALHPNCRCIVTLINAS